MNIYVCSKDKNSIKKVHWVVMSGFHKKDVNFHVVMKFEDLISKNVMKTDVVILDSATNNEFLVKNSMMLLDQTPKLIWLDERAKASSKQIHAEIKSIFN